MKRQAWLQCFLRKLKQKNFFNEIEYKLYSPGSAPASIYGTPKMHKFGSSDSFPKLRPIVSSIGTFNYNLARVLCDLLSTLVPNDYSCKDTFSFASQIKNANLSRKFLEYEYKIDETGKIMTFNGTTVKSCWGTFLKSYISII